jgi:hypothetical protein
MRIGTTNSLAMLQTQYRELAEQTQMLECQLAPLLTQVQQYALYVRVNSGDSQGMRLYKEARRKYNTMYNTVIRNKQRLYSLSCRIQHEMQKEQIQNAKLLYNEQQAMQRANATAQRRAYKQNLTNARRNGYYY